VLGLAIISLPRNPPALYEGRRIAVEVARPHAMGNERFAEKIAATGTWKWFMERSLTL
jgi:hypothetical protein